VLRNIEVISDAFSEAAAIFVENDSTDDTKHILRNWVQRSRARLIDLDGLAQTCQKRTERIAIARNRCLKEIAESDLRRFEYLVVLDLDAPNALPVNLESFLGAIEFLQKNEDVAGVFANQMPIYYDIWALRHQSWCPGDCWKEVFSAAGQLGYDGAVKKYVYDRQVFIDPASEPIAVDSAFGGLAVYKLRYAIQSAYVGSDQDGSEVADHVAFNLKIRRLGKRLLILPSLLNVTSLEHTALRNALRGIRVTANGREITLLADKEHRLDGYRMQFPLYDERFPIAAALFSSKRSGSILDIGANIGDGIALCRLHGCRSRYIGVEGHDFYFSLLQANALTHHALFGDYVLINKFVHIGNEEVSIARHAGSASLIPSTGPADVVDIHKFASLAELDDGTVRFIKIDTDGDDARILLDSIDYLRDRRPILWTEAEVFSGKCLSEWNEALNALGSIYTHMVAFDNFGLAVAAGPVDSLRPVVLALLRYVYNQRSRGPGLYGQPAMYYLDLAFFSSVDQDVFNAFLLELEELRVASV